MKRDETLVVLDTCVLLQQRVSDVLMDLRAEQLFAAHWTENVGDEFLRNADGLPSLRGQGAEPPARDEGALPRMGSDHD